jgi:HEAT repeat protein
VEEIAAALNTLRNGDFQLRWDAAKQLEHYGEEILEPLLLLLSDSEFDAELQWFIAQILGSLEHPEVILALGQLLEHSEDEDVRLRAAQSLAGLGGSAFTQLSTCLKDPHRQMAAVRALTQIDRPEVVPLLLEAAQTGKAEVRSLVFEALDPFVDPRIFGVLWDGLQDPSPEVRKAAIAALAARTQDCPAEDLVQQLIPYLEDTDLTVAAQAARSLGRLATERGAIALVQKGCQSALDPILQQTIIQALGWIGSLTAIDGLVEIWQRLTQQVPLPERRMQNILTSFAGITGSVERSRTAELVMGLVRSPLLQKVQTLRANAILCLGRLSEPAMLPALVDLLEDSDYVVRLHVVAALKQIDAVLAYEIIQQRMKETDITSELGERLAITLQEW